MKVGAKVVGCLGLAIWLHDRRDTGRFDRLHHWHLGVLMVLLPSWFILR